MSPTSATATMRVEPSPLSPDSSNAPLLERVASFHSSPWLPSVLSELRTLEASGANIEGIGDFRVSSATADNVRRLLTVISLDAIPEPSLSPFSGGGVVLIWNIGGR